MLPKDVGPQFVEVVETRPIEGKHDRIAIVRRYDSQTPEKPIVFGGVHVERVVPGSIVAAIFEGERWGPNEPPLVPRKLSGETSYGELGSLQEIGLLRSEGNRDVFLFPLHWNVSATTAPREAAASLAAQRIDLIDRILLTEVAMAHVVTSRLVKPDNLLATELFKAATQLDTAAESIARTFVHDAFRAVALSGGPGEVLAKQLRAVTPARLHDAFGGPGSTPEQYFAKLALFENLRVTVVGESYLQLLTGDYRQRQPDTPRRDELHKSALVPVERVAEWMLVAETIGAFAGIAPTNPELTAGTFRQLADARANHVFQELASTPRHVDELWVEPGRLSGLAAL